MRIAMELHRLPQPPVLELVSRSGRVFSNANLLKSCFTSTTNIPEISATQLDMLDTLALDTYCSECQADLIINCASLLSPWAYLQATNSEGRALGTVGFAAQLCSQLAPVLQLADALNRTNSDIALINGAFPDAVNVVLGKLGLAPLCGIGNGGMLYRVIRLLQPEADIKVVAHHAVVQALLTGQFYPYDNYCHIEIDGVSRRWSELTKNSYPLQRNSELNSLTAAHAVDVIQALLYPETILKTTIPAPYGLQGGYACRIQAGKIERLAPDRMNEQDIKTMLTTSAEMDGIADINENGVVHYTESLQLSLPDELAFLGEALEPHAAQSRFSQLETILYGTK